MQNTCFGSAASDYYTRLKWWMLPFISKGPNVIMDLGCASGRMGERLIEVGKAKQMIGVEIFPSAAKEASRRYTEVHVGDVEEMNLRYDNDFDYVICGDILEHLRDPCRVVAHVWKWLRTGGIMLVCVPNVRNYQVVKRLVVD